MTVSEHKLISDQDRKAIAEAYERGDKIREIEERFGVARSTIYWVLEREGKTADRIQRGRRLTGDDQQLAQLYAVIQAQEERISALERACKDLLALASSNNHRRRVAEIRQLLDS